MRFFSLFSGTGMSNSYLLGPDGGGDAILVDPGAFDEPLLEAIEGNRLFVRWILVTHAHNAHVNGIRSILKVYDASIFANQPSILDFPARHVEDRNKLSLGEFRVGVIETPGHSMDSVSYLVGHMLFTGDLLSAGSIGSTKNGYARGLLLATVRRKLLPLGDEVLIFPGHGPPSKIGIEKLYNPFLGETL